MCRPNRVVAVLAGFVLAATAGLSGATLSAQETGGQDAPPLQSAPAGQSAQLGQNVPLDLGVQADRDLLRNRLDSLIPLLEEARRAFDARRAEADRIRALAAAAATRVDTIVIGDVTVLTPLGQSDATRSLFTEVWEEDFAHLGHSPGLARSTFSFQQTADDPLPIHIEGGGIVLNRGAWASRSGVKADIRRVLAAAMSHDLRENRSQIGNWVRGNALDPLPWETIYRRIATTPSLATRTCLAGDATACGSAMVMFAGYGFLSGPESDRALLAEWYTPEERRVRVAGMWRFDRRAQTTKERCTVENDITACDDYLLQYGYDQAPLGPDIRESVVAYALEQGGDGAWARLGEDPAMTPAEALAYASGQPIDQLLERWRSELMDHRPEVFEPLVPSSGRTFLWTLLFAALAMRSTRWRLG